jgi:hypothetical protein
MRDDAGMTHLLLHRLRTARSHGLDAAAWLMLLALGLGSATGALAQGSLAERRLAITKGTAPGKLLIEAPGVAASATASAPASGAAARSATSPVPTSTAAAASGAAAPARAGWFSALPPPSGRPLQAARRSDAPDQGIVIKSAQPASAPGR